ncbi:hypothetical protein Efla_007080 [Eimeria flavescens]
MNSLQLAHKIRRLNQEWRAVLSKSVSGKLGQAREDTLQSISDCLSACSEELQQQSSWGLPEDDPTEGSLSREALTAEALLEATLAKEGLLEVVASAALSKEPLQVALKTQALELCRLIALAGGQCASLQDQHAVEDLAETCLGIFAVDASLKVKRAVLRLLRSLLAPNAVDAEPSRTSKRHLDDKPLISSPALGRILLHLSDELSHQGNKLGTTVRSELYVLIAVLLRAYSSYPLLAHQWLPPLLQQIVHRLDAARRTRKTGHVETLGALEALREVLIVGKTSRKALPVDTLRGVYAYVVTLGTQNAGPFVFPEEAEGRQAGAVVAEAAGKSLQQAALAVLQEGAEAFLSFIDSDIAADFAGGRLAEHLSAGKPSSTSCGSPNKQAKASTLLERLLSLSASSHAGIAYSASRALSRIVGALCDARSSFSTKAVDPPPRADMTRLEKASDANASPPRAPFDDAAISSISKSPSVLSFKCAAALRSFGVGLVSDLRSDSLLSPTVQAQRPEGWWQQCGCRGIVAYRCLGVFSAKELWSTGILAASACLRLAAAGCGTAWQSQHGPSCNKQALHLLAAAASIICRVLQEEQLQQMPMSMSQAETHDLRSPKRRKVFDAKHQKAISGADRQDAEAYNLSSRGAQPHGSSPEGKMSFRGAGQLPTSLYTQLRRVCVALFQLHAVAGALPRSLVPKAAAAVGRAIRALVSGAAAEEFSSSPLHVAATALEGSHRVVQQEAGDIEDVEETGQAEAPDETACVNERSAEEETSSGGSAASALRRCVRESLMLALKDHTVQPPTFVSVALLWRRVLGGDGQKDSLRGDLGDDAYKTLSQLLLEELCSFFAAGVRVQMALQHGATFGMKAFTQTLFESAKEDEDVEATETMLLQGRPTLAASSFLTAVPSDSRTQVIAGDEGALDCPSLKEDGGVATAKALVDFSLSVVSARSEAHMLQRVAACFCHLFAGPTTRRRFLSARWIAALAAVLENAVRKLTPGPGVLAILQAVRPLVDEWRSWDTTNTRKDISACSSSAAFSECAPPTPREQTSSVSSCCSCCRETDRRDCFASAEEALSGFMLQVASITMSLPAEESASGVAVLLAAPDSFLFVHRPLLFQAVREALRLGRANLPLACAAVSALRRWLRHQQGNSADAEQLWQSVLPSLRPFLASFCWEGDNSQRGAHIALLHDGAQAGFTESDLRLALSRLHSTSSLQEVVDYSLASTNFRSYHATSIRRSCLMLLGELGPRRASWVFGSSKELSLSGMLAVHSCDECGQAGSSPATAEAFLRIPLPLGTAPGSRLLCLPIRTFIVSTAKAAVDALNRQARATFCELLAVLMCAVSQKVESCLSSPQEGTVKAAGFHEPALFTKDVRAAAAAMAAVYKSILPYILELSALPDPVPRQILSPLLLRCLWTSVDSALNDAHRFDPRLTAVLEVLCTGLREDCASRRAAAASAFIAMISRLLRRLNRRAEPTAGDAVHVAQTASARAQANGVQRELVLLDRLLEQGVLLPLLHGKPAQRLGGLMVLEPVLSLGGAACRCAAARDIVVDMAFKCVLSLLSDFQGRKGASDHAVETAGSGGCSLPPPFTQEQQDCKGLELQYLQGLLTAGHFLVEVYKPACSVTVPPKPEPRATSEVGAKLAEERGHRLHFQSKRLSERLLRFALKSEDAEIRDACRTLLLSLIANTQIKTSATEEVKPKPAIGWAKTDDGWAQTAVKDIKAELERLILGVDSSSNFAFGEAWGMKLVMALDALRWLAQNSVKAYDCLIEDVIMLRSLRTVLELVWLRWENLSESKDSRTHLQLAEASIKLCLLDSPALPLEEDKSAGLAASEATVGGSSLTYAILESSSERQHNSPERAQQGPTGSGSCKAPMTEDKGWGKAAARLHRGSFERSLVVFLLQPSAFGVALSSELLKDVRRLAVSILKIFAQSAVQGKTASAGGPCDEEETGSRLRAFLEQWFMELQQMIPQTLSGEEVRRVEESLRKKTCAVRGPLIQGVPSHFISVFLAPLLAGTCHCCKEEATPWLPVLALEAYVEGLEALEDIYGRACFCTRAEKKVLLLTDELPEVAAEAAVAAAANLLGKARRCMLLEEDRTAIENDVMTVGRRIWQQVVALLLRFGLLFLRCAASCADGFELALSGATTTLSSNTSATVAPLHRLAQTFMSIASFPLPLLVPPVCETSTMTQEGLASSFLSCLKVMSRHIFNREIGHPPICYLLHVLTALTRRQIRTLVAPAAPVAAAEPSGTLLASKSPGPSDGEWMSREGEQLLQLLLEAFELWQSSGAWESCSQDASSEDAAGSSSLGKQHAALVDLFVAVSSWKPFLKALPYRNNALAFVQNITTKCLSGTIAVSTQVRAAALRGGFLIVILADLLHEIAAGRQSCFRASQTCQGMTGVSSVSQQQGPKEAKGESEAVDAARAHLAAALRSCSDGVSAMVVAVFPLASADLRALMRELTTVPGKCSTTELKGASGVQISADARNYTVLLNALLDLTLGAFHAAAEWEADIYQKADGGSGPEALEGVGGDFAPGGRTHTLAHGGKHDERARRTEGGQPVTLPDYTRRFFALTCCLSHLHDTLREEQHCYHQRIGRFLSTLVKICSRPECRRLCHFLVAHCLTLLLADVPRQHVPRSPQQALGRPMFKSSTGVSLKRAPLGHRMVEILALPLLFSAGRSAAMGGTAFYCELWRSLWEKTNSLLSPHWDEVIPVFRYLYLEAAEEQLGLAKAIRQLQVFSSVCAFFEVLFSVTPLAVFKSAVAPLLHEPGGSCQAAVSAAQSPSAVASAGAALTRTLISAMSTAIRAFQKADVLLSRHYRERLQPNLARTSSGEYSINSLLEALRACLWKGRVRAYGCLSAAICSTQSNATLYVSLLASDSSILLSLVDTDLLSLSQRMLQQGDTALPMWAPVDDQSEVDQKPSMKPFSLAAVSGWDAKHHDFQRGSSTEFSRGAFAGLTNASLASATSIIWEGERIFLSALRTGGPEPQSAFLRELSLSIAQARAGEPLLSRDIKRPPQQRLNVPFQHFAPASLGGKRWLQSLGSAPTISSNFAAAEWSQFSAAAARHPSTSADEQAAATPQERVEALLCGQMDGAGIASPRALRYNDVVGRAAVLQLLLRVVDCVSIRFSQDWKIPASATHALQTRQEISGPLSEFADLPPVFQALLKHCNNEAATSDLPGSVDGADADEDRLWAFRLVLLRIFIQRADLLYPLADRGLLDFVAESLADRRFLSAKRLHYWLRDIALLLVRWIQVADQQDSTKVSKTGSDLQLPPPALRPLTAARLAAFAETLIRLCTCRDVRTHRLNLELVGALVERLHCRLSAIGSSGGIPRLLAPNSGIPFLQLSLPSFFLYESSRSVEETAQFRLSGVAVIGILCSLESMQRTSLLLDGGPYRKILSTRSLLLAVSRSLFFPSISVAIQAAGACGLLLSVLPMELLLGKGDSKKRTSGSQKEDDNLRLTGHAFLTACHRRLQQLSAAEVATASGNPPTLCGCVAVNIRPSGKEASTEETQVGQESEEKLAVTEEAAKERDEDLNAKSMLYSFNYDGRFAEIAAAWANEQPLALLGPSGSLPRQTFLSLVTHVPMLSSHQLKRSAPLKRKWERKSVAILEAIRSICCCEVAEEASKSPGCAVLVASFGSNAVGAEDDYSGNELTLAQEELQAWQRESTDRALEAFAPFWGDLLINEMASTVLLSVVYLLKSLLERWGMLNNLLGAIHAMSSLLKKPPSDEAIVAALFEVCAWLRGHSQEYADSPTLLSFLLAPLPPHPKLRQMQLDYWFGDGAALPNEPLERVSFLLSSGLSKTSAPHMLYLLTAAVCHQQSQLQRQEQPQDGSKKHRNEEASNLASSRYLAALASMVLGDNAEGGGPSLTLQNFPVSRPIGGASLSRAAGPGRMWGGTTQHRGLRGAPSLSLLASATLVSPSGRESSDFRYFSSRRSASRRRQAQVSPAASESSDVDELDLRGGSFGYEMPASSRGAAKWRMSRATGVAINERRRRKMLALLRRHQDALAGKEDAVVLVRDCYSPGNPLQFVATPMQMLQLVREASRLNAHLATEFLLLTVLAHSVPQDEDRALEGASQPPRINETDLLGLASAGRQVLESCCKDSRRSSSFFNDRPFLCFLQRLLLQACIQRDTSMTGVMTCSPMQLYELAKATETLDVALPLLEEMASRQQRLSLSALGRQLPLLQLQQAKCEVAGKLRPYFSALYLTYGQLGQPESQKSALQLLVLHQCFKKEATNSLLRFSLDVPSVIPRHKMSKVAERGSSVAEGKRLEEFGDQGDDLDEEACLARQLLRDAHLQSLQRMMQWKPLLDCYASPLDDASRDRDDRSAAAMTHLQRARETADLKMRAELGGGCIARAVLALSLTSGAGSSSATMLTRLMRHLSPAQFWSAQDSVDTAEDSFEATIPSPLKAVICQLVSLHAASKGLLLDASLLAAKATSELQGLISGSFAALPSLFLFTVTRLSLSLLIEKGISGMQEVHWRTGRLSPKSSSGEALESFLTREFVGAVRAPGGNGPAPSQQRPLFKYSIEAAPFSGCLDGLLAAFTFIGATEQAKGIEALKDSGEVCEDDIGEVAAWQQRRDTFGLRCCAVSATARELMKERGGLPATAALLQDLLQSQKEVQQERQRRQVDLKLFCTVVKLRLREMSSQLTARSNVVTKAQHLLRSVQHEASVSSGCDNLWEAEEDATQRKSDLIALQLSCHCAFLHELQRPGSSLKQNRAEMLKAASSEALQFLLSLETCSQTMSSALTEQADPGASKRSAVSVSADSLRRREKCLWRCAALAKEILSVVQDAGHRSERDESTESNTADGHLDDGETKSVVTRLFCNAVVDLVRLAGSSSTYGQRGIALIPSVLLLCADASRNISTQCRHLSPFAGQIQAEDTPESSGKLSNTPHLKELDPKGEDVLDERLQDLELRFKELLGKIQTTILGIYFPQLLSFISADTSGCLTRALMPRLCEVIAADPHRAFYFIQATSAALRAEVTAPHALQESGGAQAGDEQTSLVTARERTLLSPTSLLNLLLVETLRRGPIVGQFAAACELLQPPERRLRLQLLERLKDILEEASATASAVHMQSEQCLTPSQRAKWRKVWMSACERAIIGDHHAVLGEAVDLHTRQFARQMAEVVCNFLKTKTKTCSAVDLPEVHARLPLSEQAVDAMLGLSIGTLTDLLRLLSSEASGLAVAEGVGQHRELRLSDVSPWLSRFSSEWLSETYWAESEPVGTRHRFPVPFWSASAPVETPDVLSFCERVVALPSKQLPLRLSYLASDGYCYSILSKGGEDLRLDQRIQTLMSILKFGGDKTLRLRSYGVLPMSETHGIVEWIACSSPLVAVCETYVGGPLASSLACQRYASFLSNLIAAVEAGGSAIQKKSPTIADVWSKIFELPAASVESMFRECVECATTHTFTAAHSTVARVGSSPCGCSNCSTLSIPAVPPAKAVLQCLVSIAEDMEELTEFRKRFGASLAASGAICYFLGVGDRHLGNCLLDLKTGECVNIDFGYAFDVAVRELPVPEIAPIRLSPCLLHVVGPPGGRDSSVLHSSFFEDISGEDRIPSLQGNPADRTSLETAAPHAWAAGALGLFENRFADALDFVRAHRLVFEAIVEMLVREPYATFSEADQAIIHIDICDSFQASRQKAAMWSLEEGSDLQAAAMPEREDADDDEAPTQHLCSTRTKILSTQRPNTKVAPVPGPSVKNTSLHTLTRREGVQEAAQVEEAVRRMLAFVKRKLRGEHPSLVLLDLLKSHSEASVLY